MKTKEGKTEDGRWFIKTTFKGGEIVSTVSMEMPSRLGGSLMSEWLGYSYETMIFGGPCSDFCLRYESKNKAREGHKQTIKMVLDRYENAKEK